jgi:phosphoribosylamine--glycine ligase
MNILVIGSGGREHSIVRALSKSKSTTKLFAIPGNPGMVSLAECKNVDISNEDTIICFCKEYDIDLVVIGPEQPIADGLSDMLREHNISVFAPSQFAAQLETSKAFAKDFMMKYGIPTAKYATFVSTEFEDAVNYIKNMQFPVVIKADGLAGGKGVVIASNQTMALDTLQDFFNGRFGEASQAIVIEEFMQGEEVSIFAITDGNDFITLPPSQDHKRIGEGDIGKNTGGMGAYTPVSIVTADVLDKIKEKIIKPTLAGIQSEDNKYIGCLYCGLMIHKGEPRVVEFNCRFGDPETQAVLSTYEGDFALLLKSAADGHIDKTAYIPNNKAACCVIMASDGYPDKYETGCEILGDAFVNTENAIVYHSGTKINEVGKLVVAGGRVLGVTAVADNIKDAIAQAYDVVARVSFGNMYYRRDIGYRELERQNDITK